MLKKLKKKTFEKNRQNFFFRFLEIFFRRNRLYDEYITHAKFHDRRSRGSGDTRGGTDKLEDLLYRSALIDIRFSRAFIHFRTEVTTHQFINY